MLLVKLIFRLNESRRGKLVTVAGLVVVAFAIYGGLNQYNFLPSDSASAAAPIMASIVSLAITLACWRDRNPSAPYNSFGPLRRTLAIGIITLVFFGLGWMTTLGLSGAIVRTGPIFVAQASVATVYPERRGKGCHYRLQLRTASLSTSISPCVPEELWHRAKPGIPVTLVMASGALGAQVVDVRIEN